MVGEHGNCGMDDLCVSKILFIPEIQWCSISCMTSTPRLHIACTALTHMHNVPFRSFWWYGTICACGIQVWWCPWTHCTCASSWQYKEEQALPKNNEEHQEDVEGRAIGEEAKGCHWSSVWIKGSIIGCWECRTTSYGCLTRIQHETSIAAEGAYGRLMSKIAHLTCFTYLRYAVVVMEQCKTTEKEHRFVQNVTCTPEPMAVCSDQQLLDINCFCCDPFQFCIWCRPNLQPQWLQCYTCGLSTSSVGRPQDISVTFALGPILVHYRKLFRRYHYFFSMLVGLKSSISGFQATRTDGEKNLVDALSQSLPHAHQLQCFCHLQQNIKSHLRDQQFPKNAAEKYVHNIFGYTNSDGVYHEGLLDCLDAEAFERIMSMEMIWKEREKLAFSDRKSYQPQFFSWFKKCKASEFWKHTFWSLWEESRLGSPPPKMFYTNDNELVNAALKECVN